MHHLTAYFGSISANSNDSLIPAVTDQAYNVQSQRYMFQEDRRLLRAYAGIPDGTACRIDSPTFNGFMRPVIAPIDADSTLGGNLPPIVNYGDYQLTIRRLENVGILATRAGSVVANSLVLLWHTSSFTPAPRGMAYTMRATSNVTSVAGGWALGQLTFDQQLPSGKYAVIGMLAYGDNVLAARLVFPGQGMDRPGVLANVDTASWQFPSMRFGNSGLFGTFENTNSPQVEIFSQAALSGQNYILDLVKLN